MTNEDDAKFFGKILRNEFEDSKLSHKDHVRIGYILLNTVAAGQAVNVMQAVVTDLFDKFKLPNSFDRKTTELWVGRIQKAILVDWSDPASCFEEFWNKHTELHRSKA